VQVVDQELIYLIKYLLSPTGETISYSVGSSGANGTGVYSGSAGGGASTTISGSTTGSIFTLTGGGGASASGGGVQGPLRSNTAGTAGSATMYQDRL
jgi:hypothetical protein